MSFIFDFLFLRLNSRIRGWRVVLNVMATLMKIEVSQRILLICMVLIHRLRNFDSSCLIWCLIIDKVWIRGHLYLNSISLVLRCHTWVSNICWLWNCNSLSVDVWFQLLPKVWYINRWCNKNNGLLQNNWSLLLLWKLN